MTSAPTTGQRTEAPAGEAPPRRGLMRTQEIEPLLAAPEELSPSLVDLIFRSVESFLQSCIIRPNSSKFKRIADVTVAQAFAKGEWNRLFDKYFGPSSASRPRRRCAGSRPAPAVGKSRTRSRRG